MNYPDHNNTAGALTNQAYVGAQNTLTRQPRLDQLADRFEKSLAEFHTLTQRLQNVADRILGPVPEAVDSNKAPPSPSATVGKIESMTEALGHLLRRLQQSTERLETL